MKETHNAFHASRLRPYLTTAEFPARAALQAVPETKMVQGEEHFKVQRFYNHRLVGHAGRHLQLLVQFKGIQDKGTESKGRPASVSQQARLAEQLQQELKRAKWAAGEIAKEIAEKKAKEIAAETAKVAKTSNKGQWVLRYI